MQKYHLGEICIAQFPFEPPSRVSKVRPVFVWNDKVEFVIASMITSKIRGNLYEIIILPDTTNKLILPSVIRIDRTKQLMSSKIIRSIGYAEKSVIDYAVQMLCEYKQTTN